MRNFLVGLLVVSFLAALGLGFHYYLRDTGRIPADLRLTDFLPQNYLLRLRFQNSGKLHSELNKLLVVRRLKESRFHEFYRQFLKPIFAGQTAGLPTEKMDSLNSYFGEPGTLAVFNSESNHPALLLAVKLDFSADKTPADFDRTVDELMLNFGDRRRNFTVQGTPLKQVTFRNPYLGFPLTVAMARVNNFLLLAPRHQTVKRALTEFLPAPAPEPLAVGGPPGERKNFMISWEITPGLGDFGRRVFGPRAFVSELAENLWNYGSVRGKFEFEPPHFQFSVRSQLPDTGTVFRSDRAATSQWEGLKFFPEELVFFRDGRVPRSRTLEKFAAYWNKLFGNRGKNLLAEHRGDIDRLFQLVGDRYSLGATLNLSYFRSYLDTARTPKSLPVDLLLLIRSPTAEKFLDELEELAARRGEVEVNRSSQRMRLKKGERAIDMSWRRSGNYLFFSSDQQILRDHRKRVERNQTFATNSGFQRLRTKFSEPPDRITYVSCAPLAELAKFSKHERLTENAGYRTLKGTLNFEPLEAGSGIISSMPGTLTVSWTKHRKEKWRSKTIGSGDFLLPILGIGVSVGLATLF